MARIATLSNATPFMDGNADERDKKTILARNCSRLQGYCTAWVLLRKSALAALVVDHLEAEDGQGTKEHHEGAQDAVHWADEGGPVVVALSQVVLDADGATARNADLHRAVRLR